MDEQLKNNLTSSKHWIRLLFMILFALALQVASIVMTALVVVQFLFALISGNDNLQLRKFGDSLSIFIFDTLQFLIYNSEDKPFPFDDWPDSTVSTAKPAVGSKATAKPKKAAARSKAAAKKKAEAKPAPEGSQTKSANAGLSDENKTRTDTE